MAYIDVLYSADATFGGNDGHIHIEGLGRFATFLNATRLSRDDGPHIQEVRDEDGDYLLESRGPHFDRVRIDLFEEISPDVLQAFVDRLDGSVRCTATRRLTCKRLILVIKDQWEGFSVLWEGFPMPTDQLGNALLGNLISLLSVSELVLSIEEGFVPPPRLIASLIDALPSAGTTLNDLSLALDVFDALTAQALTRVIPQLTELRLFQEDTDAAPDPTISPAIVRAVLESEIASLTLHCFGLSTIESECWDLLAGNRFMKELHLINCYLGVDAFELFASALKLNTTLQKLILVDDGDAAPDGIGAFGEVLAVNASLEELEIVMGRMQESDPYDLSNGLRRNRTLKVLSLHGNGLTPHGIQRLLETIRYDNSTLEQVLIPSQHFPLEQEQLDLACRFHKTFHASCQALQGCAADLRDAETAFGQWWPLLGSNHLTIKATVLFCLVQVRAEVAAQSLKAPSPCNRGGDGIASSFQGTFTRGPKRSRWPQPVAEAVPTMSPAPRHRRRRRARQR